MEPPNLAEPHPGNLRRPDQRRGIRRGARSLATTEKETATSAKYSTLTPTTLWSRSSRSTTLPILRWFCSLLCLREHGSRRRVS